MAGIATKSYVSYVLYIVGGLVVVGVFLYYRNSSPVQTSAPTTTAPTTTAPTTAASTLPPYVPWYSTPQVPSLQIVPKSNMSCQQCVNIQQDLKNRMEIGISDLLKLNTENLEKQLQELGIELRKRGKSDQEIQQQIELLDKKSQEFTKQILKFRDVDITYDICGNMCPTCKESTTSLKINPPTIRFCMNGAQKADEAADLFRKTGVTPSPMMTVPPPQ